MKNDLLARIDLRLKELQPNFPGRDELQIKRDDIRFWDQSSPIPTGANELLELGVDLVDLLSAYPDAENDIKNIFGETVIVSQSALVKSQEELLHGNFERAIFGFNELRDDAEVGNVALQRLLLSESQQNKALRAYLERAEKLAAADAPQEEIVQQAERALIISHTNLEAQNLLGRYKLKTTEGRDREYIDQLQRRLDNREAIGTLQSYPIIIAELRSLESKYADDPTMNSLVNSVMQRIRRDYDELRKSLGQLNTAEALGQHDIVINQIEKFLQRGEVRAPDATNTMRDLNDWLQETQIKKAHSFLSKAQERFKVIEDLDTKGEPITALKYLDEVHELLEYVREFYPDLNRFGGEGGNKQELFRALNQKADTLRARLDAEQEKYKSVTELVSEAESLREGNINEAINKLRSAKRIYDNYPNLLTLISEYENLKGQVEVLGVNNDIFVLEVNLDAARRLEDLETLQSDLNLIRSKIQRAPESITNDFQRLQRKFVEKRVRLQQLNELLNTIGEAVRQRNLISAQKLFEQIPDEYSLYPQVILIAGSINPGQGSSVDEKTHNALKRAYQGSQWQTVLERSEEIQTSHYIDWSLPYTQRAQIYLLEQQVDLYRLTGSTIDLQHAAELINQIKTICNNLVETNEAGVERRDSIEQRVNNKLKEITADIEKLGEVVRIETQVMMRVERREFSQAARLLVDHLQRYQTNDERHQKLSILLQEVRNRWVEELRSAVNQVTTTPNQEKSRLFELYRIYVMLDKDMKLIQDSDNDWVIPLKRLYHWQQAQMVTGEEALEHLQEALHAGFPLNDEVKTLRTYLTVHGELDKIEVAEQQEGTLTAAIQLYERIQSASNTTFSNHPLVNDKLMGYFETMIDRGVSAPDFDPFLLMRRQISDLRPRNGYSEYTDYWQIRFNLLRALRQRRYQDYIDEENKFGSKLSLWRAATPDEPLSDNPEIVSLFTQRLNETEGKFKGWRTNEVEKLTDDAIALAKTEPLRAIENLGWALRMNPDYVTARNLLDDLIRNQLQSLINEIQQSYTLIKSRAVNFKEALSLVNSLHTTTQTIVPLLREITHRADNPLNQQLINLDQQLNNYQSNLQQIKTRYEMGVRSLEEGIKTRNRIMANRAFELLNSYRNNPHVQYISDLQEFINYVERVKTSVETLDDSIRGLVNATRDERPNDAEMNKGRIITAETTLRNTVGELKRLPLPFEDVNFDFIFIEHETIVSESPQQSVEMDGEPLIQGGYIRGINNHIHVARIRARNGDEWRRWWVHFADLFEEWLIAYMTSLYGMESYKQYYVDGSEVPIYLGIGFKATKDKTTGLTLAARTALERELDKMPNNLISIIQYNEITKNLKNFIEVYRNPRYEVHDLYAVLNEPIGYFVRAIRSLVKIYIDDGLSCGQQKLRELNNRESAFNQLDIEIQRGINEHKKLWDLSHDSRRRGRMGEADKYLNQCKTQVRFILKDLRLIQEIDPSYRCVDQFNDATGEIKLYSEE